MTGILNLLAGSIASAVKDTYFNLVTLLLPGNGTNGAQNNTFLDSSTNNFTITRNGNTTQGTFSPFSQTGWSNYFDGTGDTLSLPNNAAFAMSNGAFTIEFWFYTSSISQTGYILQTDTNSTALYLSFSSSTLRLTDASTVYVSTPTLVANQWYHIAVVRSGTGTNQTVIYTNGVAGTAGTCAQSFTQAGPVIGGNGYLGYISNLRIVKGSAVYTSAFTPPTAPLTNITNTSLLTCQSNRFVDNGTANSGSGFAITPSGDVSVQAFSPFLPTAAYSAATVGGSAYFDGTGDYLQSASSTTLQLGSSDFSIEWWEYRDVVGSDDTPVTTGDYAVAYGVMLLGYSGQAGFISTNGSSWNVLASPAYIDTLNAKSWNHFVYTRSGTAFRVFMNGKLSNYATGSGSVTQNNNQFNLGGNTGGGQYSFPGYIAGFRVVKGSIPTDYQTSSTTTGTVVFTPPAAPPTTTSQGATANDVELLLNMTNAAITDATAKNDLETVGNAQISTTQSKFGGSSMYFDGTGDYLKVPSSPNLALGTGDFTVEFWAYPTTFVNFSQWVSTRVADDASYWGIDSNSSGVFYFFTNGIVVQSSAQSLNTWVHIAAVRSGTTFKLYINGVSAGSATLTNNFLIANGLGVGAGANGAQTAYGYIDDVRITRGYARYTSNFTPPTSAFALQ